MKNLLLSSLVIIYFGSCQDSIEKKSIVNNNLVTPNNTQQDFLDSAKRVLQDADIVLRRGNDAISDMFAQLNKSDCSYSHCGIAFQENNIWYVYHSIGGEDNPNAKLKKETLEKFTSPISNSSFGICSYPLKANQIKAIKQTADSAYRAQIPFDMDFSLASNDKFYCAEMVYKTYQTALGNDTFFNITHHLGFRYVSTDNIFVNKKALLKAKFSY